MDLHTGQWFRRSDSKNKVYKNLTIFDGQYEKPTKSLLESELFRMEQVRKDTIQTNIDNKTSAKVELEALGLTADKVKYAFGI